MRVQFFLFLFLIAFVTGPEPVRAAVRVANTPIHKVENTKSLSKKERTRLKRQQRKAIRQAIKENLTADYLLAGGAAVFGVLLPWIVYVSLYGGFLLGLFFFLLPISLGIAVFIRHGKRKKRGGQTPFIIRLLAGIGLVASGIWLVLALLSQ